MSAVLTGILVLCGGAILVSGYMLWWNSRVYRLRLHLLERISEAGKADIREGCDWQWRYDAFDEISYTQMFARPWRRPLSLYPDLDFANPAVKRERTP